MANNPIIRNFYNEDTEVEIIREPARMVYELFLYSNTKKGSFPKYKITGSDKISVLSYANDIINKFNVKQINDGKHWFTTADTSMYDSPICTDIETGELI